MLEEGAAVIGEASVQRLRRDEVHRVQRKGERFCDLGRRGID